MNLHPIEYQILYNNANITKDVSDYLLSLTYTDKHSGESDEVELEMHDKDLLWQNDWWPAKGAKLSVQIMDGDLLLDCGSFTIDEHEYTTSRSDADKFKIRGMAAVITKALRTKNSSAHENKTLKELANTVASKHALTLVGTIADISISRITQFMETDLGFLHRISERYGYTFSIRDSQLIFTSLKDLITKPHVLSVDKSDCVSFSFKTSSNKVTKESTVSYHSPEKQEVITKTVTRAEVKQKINYDYRGVTGGAGTASTSIGSNASSAGTILEEDAYVDDAVSNYSADNEKLAEIMAETRQIQSVLNEEKCEIECPGNVLLITGNQVELTGFGRFSGIYYIIESAHSVDRSASYVTKFTANKTGQVETKKHHAKSKKANDDMLPPEGPDYNSEDTQIEE